MEEAAAIQTQLAASEVTEGKIIRTAWRQAWPMTVAQFASAAYTLVDMFFVGKLGRDAIAAVALGGIVDNVSWIIMTGVVIANKVFISREIGAGRWKEAAHSSYQSLLFGFVLSLFVAIPCFFLARETLIVMGAQGEVVTQGLGYLQILSLGVLVSFQVQVARSIFEAVGDPKIPMKILVVSNILNAILAPALIWGVGIIPALGVNGAALAVVLARLFALGWFMILLRRTGLITRRAWRQKPDYALIYRFMQLGVPRCLQRGVEVISGMLLMRIVAGYGTAALAAYGVGLRIDLAMKTPGWGFSSSVITLVGQNLGAGKPERAEKSVWVIMAMYLAFAALCGLAFFFAPGAVMGIFTRDPEVLQIGSQYLRIMTFGYIFIAVAMVSDRAMSGAGDTVTPMVVACISLVVLQLSGALLLPRITGLGALGIWIAIALSYGIWAGTILRFFRQGQWKHRKL